MGLVDRTAPSSPGEDWIVRTVLVTVLASYGIILLSIGSSSAVLRGPLPVLDESWRTLWRWNTAPLFFCVPLVMLPLVPLVVAICRQSRIALALAVAGWLTSGCLAQIPSM